MQIDCPNCDAQYNISENIALEIEHIVQCTNCLEIWKNDSWPELADLPTAGQILEEMTDSEVDGGKYGHSWPKKSEENV